MRDGVWHWRKTIQGHTFSKSTKTADKKAAEVLETLWEAEALKEILVKGTKPVNLHDVIAAFLAARKGTGGGPNAQVHLRHFLALPNIRMSDVTLPMAQGAINKRREAGTAHNTLCVTVSYWNALVKFAEDQKWTTSVRLTPLVPIKTRKRYLTPDEEAAIFSVIDPAIKYPGKNPIKDAQRQDNTDMLLALLQLGCRFNEVVNMRWNQIDLVGRTVLVLRSKGGIDGTLGMSDKLHAMFTRRHAERQSDFVFPNKRGANNNYVWLRRALEKAGISEEAGKITQHTMRHTFASRMLQNGLSLLEVKQLLGHNSIQSTLVYAHIETGAVAEKAAQIMNKF